MKVLLEKMIIHHPELPRDPRTLFSISKNAISPNLHDVFPGKYYHFGIQNGLCQLIPILKQACLIGENNLFKLKVGIDGLPLFKSTIAGFWPITAAIDKISNSVFLVGLYYGENKPKSCQEFTFYLVNEMKLLSESGFIFEEITYNVEFLFCNCDMPAKSFLKCVKGHTAYFGCDRCKIKGTNFEHRRIYEGESSLRTNGYLEIDVKKNIITKCHLLNPLPILI
ncbi:uncharacterized protein LOC136095372 [Hydra vulgaris]|uniref:uncharacterized protein LOC136095372 n=1 Tax=Hydra vulgaris TaxID=6087 RepID=UPI0032E9CC18